MWCTGWTNWGCAAMWLACSTGLAVWITFTWEQRGNGQLHKCNSLLLKKEETKNVSISQSWHPILLQHSNALSQGQSSPWVAPCLPQFPVTGPSVSQRSRLVQLVWQVCVPTPAWQKKTDKASLLSNLVANHFNAETTVRVNLYETLITFSSFPSSLTLCLPSANSKEKTHIS